MEVEAAVEALNTALRLQQRSRSPTPTWPARSSASSSTGLAEEMSRFALADLDDRRTWSRRSRRSAATPRSRSRRSSHGDRGAHPLADRRRDETIEALQDVIPTTGQEGRSRRSSTASSTSSCASRSRSTRLIRATQRRRGVRPSTARSAPSCGSPDRRRHAAARVARSAAADRRQRRLRDGHVGGARRPAVPDLHPDRLGLPHRPARGVELGPLVVLSLLGGALADRHDRRRLLLADQLAIVVTASLLALGAFPAPRRSGCSTCSGRCSAASARCRTSSARRSCRTSSRPARPLAIALNFGLFQLTYVVGPSLGGVLIGALGVGAAYTAMPRAAWRWSPPRWPCRRSRRVARRGAGPRVAVDRRGPRVRAPQQA